MKKLLMVLLSICISVPFALAAVGCKKGEKATAASEFKFRESSNGYWYIDRFVGSSKNVVIPSTYKGKDVISINDSAFYETKIESVVIPSTVWNIYMSAFSGCDYLKSVTVKSGKLTKIYENAFDGCQYLKTTDLSNCSNLETIGFYAFQCCYDVTTINFSGCTKLKTIGERAFYECDSLEVVDFSDCTSLKKLDASIFDKSGLREIILPQATQIVGEFNVDDSAEVTVTRV